MRTVWRIEMLGWLRAVMSEQHVTRFRRQKTGSLLAYLAYHCHRSHPRELLIELLWPECDPAIGRNRLSVALSSLRRQLEPPGIPAGAVIRADHHTVQLNPEAVSTDVAAFETAPGEILLSETTAVLLQGRLAPGVRLREKAGGERGDRDGATRLFTLSPVAPSPSPSAAGGETAPAPYLPLQVTRFFGRERELAQLRDVLLAPLSTLDESASDRMKDGARASDGRRLVTLTGPGGSGKTRLAVEAARQLSAQMRESVWFVPLQEILDTDRVIDRLMSALRLTRSLQVEPWDQVVKALSTGPTMLILDNFEQLVPDGVRLVQRLLEQIPSLTLLTTSRRRLGLPGEQEFPVLPLPVPDEGERDRGRNPPSDSQHPSPETLIGFPSVRLFVDRAQAVRPDFQVTRTNAAAVAGICARLEGLPLALELGAARIGAFTPAQMLARIEQRFEWLSTRKRGVIDRHRSLRTALEWSYALLTPELQRCFCRLSVFRGGWTLAGAEAVCGQGSARDHLAMLQEASLVLAEGSGDAWRYRMLETLREYGSEQIERRERTEAARRHLEYYLSGGGGGGRAAAPGAGALVRAAGTRK